MYTEYYLVFIILGKQSKVISTCVIQNPKTCPTQYLQHVLHNTPNMHCTKYNNITQHLLHNTPTCGTQYPQYVLHNTTKCATQ